MNAWRKELATLLEEISVRRAAALRRSRESDALYATDLPAVTTGDGKQAFCRKAMEAGWTVREEKGWMLLDRPIAEPPAGWFSGTFGAEARCCASLIYRQLMREEKGESGGNGPAGDVRQMKAAEDGQRAARQLIKAAEEGGEALERVCLTLHRDWAGRLRRGERLPEISCGFFGEDVFRNR